jgi:uncharacterized protein YjbI with pentapeptide repeats
MGNQSHFQKLKNSGVDKWNEWREDNPHEIPDFSNQNFDGVLLAGANLKNAKFNGAQLDKTKGLIGVQLAGANLAGTHLPQKLAKFESLKLLNERIGKCHQVYLVMCITCTFVLITIFNMPSISMFSPFTIVKVPFLNMELSASVFTKGAPFFLLVIYFYFHLKLSTVWEGIAQLPAKFPDGRALDQHLYPWLLIRRIRRHFGDLDWHQYLSLGIPLFLSWLYIPFTLGFYWYGIIAVNDVEKSTEYGNFFAISIFISFVFYSLEKEILTNNYEKIELRFFKLLVLGIALSQLVCITTKKNIHKNGQYYEEEFENLDLQNHNLDKIELIKVKFNGSDLSRTRFEHATLTDVDFTRAIFKETDFYLATLVRPKFNFSKMDETDLSDTKFDDAQFENSRINGANFSSSNFDVANFSEAKLSNVSFLNSHMKDVKFSDSNLENTNFRESVLDKVYFSKAILIKTDFRWAKIKNAYFREVQFENANFSEAVVSSGKFVRASLVNANFMQAELDKSNFDRADLSNAILSEASLASANFSGAVLKKVNFFEAVLTDVDFSDADLSGANFYQANIVGAEFFGANLQDADLTGAIIRNADFFKANLRLTRLEGVDLSKASGLFENQIRKACIDNRTKLPEKLENLKDKIINVIPKKCNI